MLNPPTVSLTGRVLLVTEPLCLRPAEGTYSRFVLRVLSQSPTNQGVCVLHTVSCEMEQASTLESEQFPCVGFTMRPRLAMTLRSLSTSFSRYHTHVLNTKPRTLEDSCLPQYPAIFKMMKNRLCFQVRCYVSSLITACSKAFPCICTFMCSTAADQKPGENAFHTHLNHTHAGI